MGGSSSPPANTTSSSTTKTEPPSVAIPYIDALLKRSNKLSKSHYQDYTGQQVAPLTQAHQQGMSIVSNRASQPNALMTSANNQATNTLSGKYMTSGARNSMAGVNNPYLNQVIANTNQDVARQFTNSMMPQQDASFARQGAFGGSAWQNANTEANRQMAAELAKNTSNLRMGDYSVQQQLAENKAQRDQSAWDSERGRMVGAISPSQQLSNQPYTDAMQMLGIGDIQRDYTQTGLNTAYQNWLDKKNADYQNLDVLANAIRTAMGGGGTSVTQATMPKVNTTANLIGGGLAGMQLGGMIGSQYGNTGMGSALGAGAGALAGLL